MTDLFMLNILLTGMFFGTAFACIPIAFAVIVKELF